MRRLLLQVLGQVDDLNRIEGTLLDADAATDAQVLGDVRDFTGAANLDA